MKLKKYKNFYSGTSNVVLPVPNKGHYPPEFQDKSRLHFYSSLFNSVEVNRCFYKLPKARTVERWATETGKNFRFTFKLCGAVTHAKELAYDVADIKRFVEVVNHIGDKKGCLLVQFPASIKASLFQKFKRLMGDINDANTDQQWKLAIEFRDKSWYRDSVYQLLEQCNAAVVMHDMPASTTPLIDMETSFVYMRFHGENGKYRGSYEDDLLEEHAIYIKDCLSDGKQVFVYFNNTMGDAVHNLVALNGM
ncbi:MAG: DUF72 domain-containing protein [Bacteroidota bacterium]